MQYPDLIPPVDPAILEQELTEDLYLRQTNRAKNKIYVFRAHQAPNVMQELGRLREEAFRYYGGGSGKPADIDELDLAEDGYRQLIVWDPDERIIIGGYRYILGQEVPIHDGEPGLSTAEIFRFDDHFMKEVLPYMIELGRSFVRVDYQQARLSPKSIFAVDNLWDGLGALAMLHDEYRYFFGKVTMYKEYNLLARDLILYYMRVHFKPDHMDVTPIYPITHNYNEEDLREVIPGEDLKADYKRLNKAVRDLGVNIPPLINAYIGLSTALKYYGTSINPEFSGVEESAIIVPVEEIYEEKKTRHMYSFLRDAATRISESVKDRMRSRLGRTNEASE